MGVAQNAINIRLLIIPETVNLFPMYEIPLPNEWYTSKISQKFPSLIF